MNVVEKYLPPILVLLLWYSPVESSFNALLCYQHRAWCLNLATHRLFPSDDYGEIIHSQVKPVKQK